MLGEGTAKNDMVDVLSGVLTLTRG